MAGQGDIPLCTLDSLGLPMIDLLKIDVEGYELEVLQGAAATIVRCRPVVIVEQRAKQVASFQHGPADAVAFLRHFGATVAWTDKRDYVTVFPGGPA